MHCVTVMRGVLSGSCSGQVEYCDGCVCPVIEGCCWAILVAIMQNTMKLQQLH